MLCVACGAALPVRSGPGRKRQVCNDACWQKGARRRRKLQTAGVPTAPLCLHGRFQDYEDTFAGKIDVILTDLPYTPKVLPLYEDLGRFALTTLVPGGWLLCLTGWGIDLEIRRRWNEGGLEFKTVCCYQMPSVHSQGKKYSSTGPHVWQEHHKPLLWYQKPGTSAYRRRGGTSDLIPCTVLAPPDMDQKARAWQQSFHAFREMVRIFTNPQDVVCDPCMGWGTTLSAAVSLERRRCIGIELLAERYSYACEQLTLAGALSA